MPTPARTPADATPRVTVLLATHNGLRWLPEQLASILGQEGVLVQVVALDDASSDGTREWLRAESDRDARLTVLPAMLPSGSAAANFYRLIALASVATGDLVAFSDQDDIWAADKLARHAALLETGHDGISSDVTAFDSRGHRTLIRKSYTQVQYDYLLESPGPGSTFLMSPRLFALVRETLGAEPRVAHDVDFHDCLVYAICRAHGWSWHIDDVSSVDYRQHDQNVRGANVGTSSALTRLRLVRSRWHRNQAVALATVGLKVAPPVQHAELEWLRDLMTARGVRSRWTLARRAGTLRRRPRDQRIIALLIVLGIW